MKLQVRSNGKIVEMKKSLYDSLPEDAKRSYNVISKEDVEEKKAAPVKNEVAPKEPPSGDGKGK